MDGARSDGSTVTPRFMVMKSPARSRSGWEPFKREGAPRNGRGGGVEAEGR